MTRKALPFLVCLLFGSVVTQAETGLSAEDVTKIKQVHRQYEQAWLEGNADRVRALFTEDSVLLPHHGVRPRVGRKEMNEFWFPPDAPPSKVLKLELNVKDVGGNGSIAYAWGMNEVAWTVEQDGKTKTVSNKGTFLNVLKKQSTGEWKFSHQMWDDPLPQQQ